MRMSTNEQMIRCLSCVWGGDGHCPHFKIGEKCDNRIEIKGLKEKLEKIDAEEMFL